MACVAQLIGLSDSGDEGLISERNEPPAANCTCY